MGGYFENSGDLNFRRLVMLERVLVSIGIGVCILCYEVQVLVFAILKIVSAYCAFVKDIEVRPCVQQRACSPTGGNYNIIRFR